MAADGREDLPTPRSIDAKSKGLGSVWGNSCLLKRARGIETAEDGRTLPPEPKVAGSNPAGDTDLRQLADGTCPRTCPSAFEFDEQLSKVVEAWPHLGEGIKKAIFAIIEASIPT